MRVKIEENKVKESKDDYQETLIRLREMKRDLKFKQESMGSQLDEWEKQCSDAELYLRLTENNYNKIAKEIEKEKESIRKMEQEEEWKAEREKFAVNEESEQKIKKKKGKKKKKK